MSEHIIPQCKGTLFAAVKKCFRDEFGQIRLQEAISQCSEETQKVVKSIILAEQFYPECALAEFLSRGFEAVGFERAAQLSRQISKKHTNVLLQVFIRLVVTPERLTDSNHKLWSALHNSGRLEAVHGADGKSHTLFIHDFDFLTSAYEQLFVEYHCGTLELTGAREVKGVSHSNGPRSYRQEYTWR